MKFSKNEVLDAVIKIALVIVLAYAIFAIYLFARRRSKGGYRFLGGSSAASPAYSIRMGGSRGEYNEDCMQHPGYRMCMMTDGTPGVCGLSGMCLPDMLQDLAQQQHNVNDPARPPYCPAPTFRGECQQWCECNAMAGTEGRNCLAECQSWFFPGNP